MVLRYFFTFAWVALAVYHAFSGHSEFAAIFSGMAYLASEIHAANIVSKRKEDDDAQG